MRAILLRLRRALQVEPGEGGIVGWSAAALFLMEWASVAVSNASDTLFLKRVGVSYLPLVFLVNSVLLTATTYVAGRLAVRLDVRRLLSSTYLALAGVLVVLWLLLLAGAPGISTALVILSKQIDVIAALMFWTVLTNLLTSRQGKRLVALMTAGGTLGQMFGSFASGPFGRAFGIPSLLILAAGALLIATFVAVPLARSARPRLLRSGARPATDQPLHLAEFWRDSSLFRVLVVTSFLAGLLGPVLYFEFSFAADLATRTADGEQKLLGLYSQLRGWINVGVLAVQIGASAELFRRVGVPLSAMLAPAAYFCGLIGLGVRFGLRSAMPTTMTTSVLDHTIYEPAQRILCALLPENIRTAASSVIQGPAKRGGAAFGSLLILIVITFAQPSDLAFAALPVAGLWMALAVFLWRRYPNLVLEAARVRRTDARTQEPMTALLDSATLRTLQRHLEGADAALCRAACSLFAEAPRGIAVDSLTRALPLAHPDNRSVLIETLDRVLADPEATRAAGPDLATNLLRALTSSSGLSDLERAKLVHVLGRVFTGRPVTPAIRALLERACDDESEVMRIAARAACLRTALGEDTVRQCDDAIRGGLEGDDAAARAVALSELRFELLREAADSPNWSRRLDLLTGLLDAAAPAATTPNGTAPRDPRIDAAEALADVAFRHGRAAAACEPRILELAEDADPSVRSAALRFIGNAGLAGHARLVASRLSSTNAAEFDAARTALERLGSDAADALLHALRHGGRRAREAAAGILRELRADPAALQPLIDRETARSQELVILLGAFEAQQASRLVLQCLRERIDESVHAVLELLSAVLDDPRIANVCRSLGRGWNVRDRAVLLEALDALLPAAERMRILPLLEDHSAQRLGAASAQALGRRWPTLEEAIAQAVSLRDPLMTALVAATFDRALLASAVPKLDVRASLRVLSRSARAAPNGSASPPRAADGASAPSAGQEIVMLSPVEKMLHLRTLDLFEGLTTRQLSELAGIVTELEVRDRGVIVAEGEFDDRMYFIVSGKVRIDKAGQLVAELEAGDFFGEMAVFDGETRSATATATGDVRLLRLARSDLFEVMEDQPAIGIGICQILVRRVRTLLDERLSDGSARPPGESTNR